MRRTKPVQLSLDPAKPVFSRMAVVVAELPTSANHDPLGVEVSTMSLLGVRCPEHPEARHWDVTKQRFMGWTHYRAHWARGRTTHEGDCPAVMFVCPTGHVYEVVLQQARG